MKDELDPLRVDEHPWGIEVVFELEEREESLLFILPGKSTGRLVVTPETGNPKFRFNFLEKLGNSIVYVYGMDEDGDSTIETMDWENNTMILETGTEYSITADNILGCIVMSSFFEN